MTEKIEEIISKIKNGNKMAKPFVKWAGGKTQLLNVINDNLPEHFDTYVEPFIGGGAVMFDILERRNDVERVIINDINTDLVNTYNTIKDYCDDILWTLSVLRNWYIPMDAIERTNMYLTIRESYNRRDSDSVTQAAYFIFLNRTCFNGLYRVNSKNLFNVPHGKYSNPKICDEKNLREVSEVLQKVEVRNGDYDLLRNAVGPGTFVYLDPPYRPISETSAFTSYSASGFGDEEQVRLKGFCDFVNERGGHFMMSNSDSGTFFDELYMGYDIHRVRAKRNINSKGSGRGKINELLIKNY